MRHNYKLCLHERHIIPGGVYAEDIIESIDFSPKVYFLNTIIMLINDAILMFEKKSLHGLQKNVI